MADLPGIEKKFLSALKSIYPVDRVLLAVSGGADSMAMLSLSMKYFSESSIPFTVITVNHNIRSEEESASDASFVASFCRKHAIPCIKKTVPRGFIQSLADTRKKGVEEAARHARYSCFEEAALATGASHVFLAHTKNDQIETILQRFFQGSSSSLYGIARKRSIFFRPMLDVERYEIEEYLAASSVSFCVDTTNSINTYFRNRLRNRVIPYLTSEMPGWQTGVLSGAKRSAYDADYFESQLKQIWVQEGFDGVSTNADSFLACHIALRIRYVYQALVILNITGRIPFSVIETASMGIKCETGSVMFYTKKGKLIIKKLTSTGKINSFFGIIDKECTIELTQGTLYVVQDSAAEYMHDEHYIQTVCMPFIVHVLTGTIKIEKMNDYSSGKQVSVYFIRNNDE